ncbi:MAG: hypothetical protein AAB726_00725 [Patescibacteria group bacterium]
MGELRDVVKNFPKYPGTIEKSPASVCNDGFPGTFNMSYSEAEMIEYFGQYLDYNKDLIYSKIQPVIRYQDWKHIADADEHSYRYLSLFDLADIGGAIILKEQKNVKGVIHFCVKNLYTFLIENLKLKKENLRISFFPGGDVKTATKGKYDFDYQLPSDETVSVWKELGLKEGQFLPEFSRDTLLAVNIFGLPTPWGFRHEVNYLHKGKLLDIATFEYIIYRPIFKEGKIVDLREWEHLFSISAVGLDRILMVVNDLEKTTDCPHIKPLIELCLEKSKNKDEKKAIIAAQAIRSLHRVFTDCDSFTNLTRKRKEKVRNFYTGINSSFKSLGITDGSNLLDELLTLNSTLQNYYPELRNSIKITKEEILAGLSRLGKKRLKIKKVVK